MGKVEKDRARKRSHTGHESSSPRSSVPRLRRSRATRAVPSAKKRRPSVAFRGVSAAAAKAGSPERRVPLEDVDDADEEDDEVDRTLQSDEDLRTLMATCGSAPPSMDVFATAYTTAFGQTTGVKR